MNLVKLCLQIFSNEENNIMTTEEQLDSLVETKFITPELKYYGASRPHQNLTDNDEVAPKSWQLENRHARERTNARNVELQWGQTTFETLGQEHTAQEGGRQVSPDPAWLGWVNIGLLNTRFKSYVNIIYNWQNFFKLANIL